jgi:hypothetical protein
VAGDNPRRSESLRRITAALSGSGFTAPSAARQERRWPSEKHKDPENIRPDVINVTVDEVVRGEWNEKII